MAATLSLLAPLVAAAAAQNVLHIGLQRGPAAHIQNTRSIGRRSTSTYIETLANNITGGGYYASVSIGTPPQPQTLVVDTGSSDIWIVAYNASLCTSEELQEEYDDSCGDTYNPTASSTYKLVEKGGFEIAYLDGSSSEGDYITDTFSIGDATLEALQLGSATTVDRGTGVMGIAFNASVSADSAYPNLMDQFVDQGLISSKSFSLYLNDYRAQDGALLFGGVDTDKFIGELVVLPILPTKKAGSAAYTTFAVTLDSISTKTSSDALAKKISWTGTVPAILDSGTTLSFLPNSIASRVIDSVDAYTDVGQTGYTFIDCDAGADVSVSFVFGAATITVPASQSVLDVFPDKSQIPGNVPFANACLFGIQNLDTFDSESSTTSSDYALLGDTFLRSAYAVYDMTHNEIALAPANLNSTTSSIVELKASDTAIPSLTGVASQQTTARATATGSSASGTGATSTSGRSATATDSSATSTSTNAAGPTAHGSMGALAVAGVAFLSVLGGVFVLA